MFATELKKQRYFIENCSGCNLKIQTKIEKQRHLHQNCQGGELIMARKIKFFKDYLLKTCIKIDTWEEFTI